VSRRLGQDALLRAAVNMTSRVKELCVYQSPKAIADSRAKVAESLYKPSGFKGSGSEIDSESGAEWGWGVPATGTGSGTGSGAGSGQSMASILSNLKQLEGELLVTGGPERHLVLLGDLRARLLGVEKSMNDNLSDQRALWDAERMMLNRTVQDSKNQIIENKMTSESALQSIRVRYQSMLDQAQRALEIQTSAARSQIDRLEDALRKARQQEQMDRIRHVGSTVHTQDPTRGGMRGDDSTGIRRSGQFQSDMGQREVEGQGEWEKERERDTWIAPASPSVVASLTACAKASAEELQSTKVVLQQATGELETVRALLKEMETSNASDIKDMLQESAKQARDHESTVATLQASIQAYQSEVRRLSSPEKGPKSSEEEQREALEALKDAEEQILLVEKRYQAKCSEMETLMR
jgi:hypothetical protein